MNENKIIDELDCCCTDNPVCPYCGYEEHESWEISDKETQYSCDECGKIYRIEQEFSRTFSSSKTCQPNDEHTWGKWRDYIKGESEYRTCTLCGKHEYAESLHAKR